MSALVLPSDGHESGGRTYAPVQAGQRNRKKKSAVLKEKMTFLRKPALFLPPAVGSLQETENDVSRHKNRGRREKGKDFFLLPDAESDTAEIL